MSATAEKWTSSDAYRGERSPTADGLWEIHYNPHAPCQVWVRLPKPDQPRGYGWEAVPWIHHTLVNAPFTDFTWQHIRRTVARRASQLVLIALRADASVILPAKTAFFSFVSTSSLVCVVGEP
ncbi:hypothetical protein [Streptomyces sp. 6-11-2]|uniref:hypothetical protein n=1 Tax=Streptomyces sp. 6-11-2 TaxID=2585753 RepID=UPI001C0E98EF|nr:hypothetical protein [Streptomyces sp. 6-11-2]